MNIHNRLKKQLQFSSKEQIVKELGYNSTKKGIQALDRFLESKDLYSWLHSGYFDFKYTAEQFFKKICIILDIDADVVHTELEAQKKYSEELKKFQNDYVFVNTNFKRTTQPIFVLAYCEAQRRIKLDAHKCVFKSESEILKLVSISVKQHYLKTEGNLGIWGRIESYIYHHNDKTFTFNTDGKRVTADEVNESKATLLLKGKKLTKAPNLTEE